MDSRVEACHIVRAQRQFMQWGQLEKKMRPTEPFQRFLSSTLEVIHFFTLSFTYYQIVITCISANQRIILNINCRCDMLEQTIRQKCTVPSNSKKLQTKDL